MASGKSVLSTASDRLKKDYMRLMQDPVPFVKAVPLPSNILIWHYVVFGPTKTPFEGGIYHGKLVFPREFPFKPPAIYMITPNGRFKVNQKLCLSISDFHPDTWNPAWSVSTILTGLLSFMCENTPTSGSTESSDQTKRRLAVESKEFNIKDELFCELFPEITEEIKESIHQKNLAQQQKLQSNNESNSLTANSANNLMVQRNRSWFISFINNIIVMIGLAAFAFVVKYVFSSMN